MLASSDVYIVAQISYSQDGGHEQQHTRLIDTVSHRLLLPLDPVSF